MGLPESFWAGWTIVLYSLAGLVLVLALVYSVPRALFWGLTLGFGFIALFTELLSSTDSSWLIALAVILVCYLFIKLDLLVERDVYKWTNERPNGEK